MELFKINEKFEVELNKEWIRLIPEFDAVIKADKGSKGDSDGRKKFLARKQLAYIYFMIDFKSPIYDWDYAERHTEALRYVDLQEQDVANKVVMEALEYYKTLQQKSARSLRTLEAAKKGLDALDSYLETVNFKAVDKQGKLLHSPKEFGANITTLNKVYDELAKFEKRVREELKESGTIRGTASLGDNEHRADNATQQVQWEETGPSHDTGVRFTDIGVMRNQAIQAEVQDEEEEE